MNFFKFGLLLHGSWFACLLEADETIAFGTSMVPEYTEESVVKILQDLEPEYWQEKYGLSTDQVKQLSSTVSKVVSGGLAMENRK